MLGSFYDYCLARLDTFLERFFRRPEEVEAVSFRAPLANPRKILFIPGENLCGLVQSTPFIPATLRRFPAAEVCVLTAPEEACLLENLERVRAIPCAHRGRHYLENDFRRTTALLQAEKFDWAVNLSDGPARSETLLTRHSGAHIRTGLPLPLNSRYYNLLLKTVPDEGPYIQRFSHLFRALQVEGPFASKDSLIQPTEEESAKAELFIRHRRRQGPNTEFTVCVPFWIPGQKGVVQNLQNLLTDLTRSLSPYNLLIASNLTPENESVKLESFSSYAHRFNNLRNMLAVLKACDRVVTNNAGIACLVSRLGIEVGLYGPDKENIARLDPSDKNKIRLYSSWRAENLVSQPTA